MATQPCTFPSISCLNTHIHGQTNTICVKTGHSLQSPRDQSLISRHNRPDIGNRPGRKDRPPPLHTHTVGSWGMFFALTVWLNSALWGQSEFTLLLRLSHFHIWSTASSLIVTDKSCCVLEEQLQFFPKERFIAQRLLFHSSRDSVEFSFVFHLRNNFVSDVSPKETSE